MNKCGVYSITQISTGKRYIGSSVDIDQRWASHRSSLNRNLNFNPHLQNAWNKYGKKDFLFEILEIDINPILLDERENEYIIKFEIANRDTNIFNSDRGFNMFWAGREGFANKENAKRGINHYLFGKPSNFKGMKHTDEAKKKISESQTGNPGKHNKPHSDDSKKKISEKLKGKPWSEARRAAQNRKI